MRIIDLLNKIANGKEIPKKIRFNNIEWNRIYGEKNVCYIDEYDSDFFIYLFRNNLYFTLNDKVEILEEEKKIPEKLDDDEYEYNTANETLFMRKINEIIDYLKSKGDE